MNGEKKFVESITARDVDFAKWYTDVVTKTKLCEYTSVKGCMVYMPAGYALWENIQKNLDARFKKTGVENVYMPLLIPESLLAKEKAHISGFAPEVAWVTKGGSEDLEERLCIRPTSEVLFCEHWQKNLNSYRDLPFVYNQWCSVLRWEKTTRPFLRSKEFLWQEGHTIHETAQEAQDRTRQMLQVYYDFVTEDLAIPVIWGRKTESEKFAGAEATYTIESMMHDGKALQSATSHYFGNGFTKSFDVKFVGRNSEFEYPYQTSWGLSTRIIGAIIMVHGDDDGLVLPPHIAPTQSMIIPIAEHKGNVLEVANNIFNKLNDNNIRVKIDTTDKTPGFKFANQEVLGIPLRIEIGPKDIEKNEAVVVRRDTREKIIVSLDNIVDRVHEILEQMQKDMFFKAKNFQVDHLRSALSMEEMKSFFNENYGFVKAMWCGSEECEDAIKSETGGASSRCIPFEEDSISDKCICCGKPAKHLVYWGKSY